MPNKLAIENAKKRDARKLRFSCDDCGKGYEITYGRYRHLKNKEKHRCKSCGKKLWYSDFSDDRKMEFIKKHVTNWNNKSKEEKEIINQGKRDAYNRKSQEEKDRLRLIQSERKKEYWKNLDTDIKNERLKISLNNINLYRLNMTKEEADRVSDKMSLSQITRWKNMSDEEREKMIYKGSKYKKEWWKYLTKEEYINMCYASAIKNNHRNDIVFDTYIEKDFANYLNQYKILFSTQVFNINKYPDFEKLFPYNYVTNSNHINPYHKWDFLIHTKEKDILIDIDGSIHDPNKCHSLVTSWTGIKCYLNELSSFKDSQRPYQTDGLDAYVIKCYDDKLTYDTIVENVHTKDICSFKDFIINLRLLNMDDDYIKNIIKYMK